MIRAVIFDFDGVLVDSVPIKTEAFRALFESEGPGVVRQVVAYHQAHGGLSRVEKFRYAYARILRRPLSDRRLRQLAARFEALVLEQVIRAPWVPGAIEALDTLSGWGWLLFVVSGTPEAELRMIVERRGAAASFSGVYGSPATKPELLKRILAVHRIPRQQMLMVGDALTDEAAARAAGIAFLARTTPETEAMWKARAVDRIPDLRSLPSWTRGHVASRSGRGHAVRLAPLRKAR